MSNSEIITTDNFFNSFDHNEIDDVFTIYCMCLICFAFVQKIHFFPFSQKIHFFPFLLCFVLQICQYSFCIISNKTTIQTTNKHTKIRKSAFESIYVWYVEKFIQ